MELIPGTHKASKSTTLEDDIISRMPEDVITNILHCLPIKEIVRTCILSKDWRFKWTTITQLVFDSDFFEYVTNTQKDDENYGRFIINSLLHQLKGTITKFTLYTETGSYFEFINNWVMFLSTRGIEEFTVINWNESPLDLPPQLFTCSKLKHLMLCNCLVPPMPAHLGFPNLLSLDLSYVVFETVTCGEFLTKCPLLETLTYNTDTPCVVKRDELSRLENLKVLGFPLAKLSNSDVITSSSISQFTSSFQRLHKLTLDFFHCRFSPNAKNGIPHLPFLKNLELLYLDFSCASMLSCSVELICNSPNLQTLDITGVTLVDAYPPGPFSSSEVDYSGMGQLQLKKVSLEAINGCENEVYLIKYLLACSPLLKKMNVYGRLSNSVYDPDYEKMKLAVNLSRLHRASDVADVSLSWTDN